MDAGGNLHGCMWKFELMQRGKEGTFKINLKNKKQFLIASSALLITYKQKKSLLSEGLKYLVGIFVCIDLTGDLIKVACMRFSGLQVPTEGLCPSFGCTN